MTAARSNTAVTFGRVQVFLRFDSIDRQWRYGIRTRLPNSYKWECQVLNSYPTFSVARAHYDALVDAIGGGVVMIVA